MYIKRAPEGGPDWNQEETTWYYENLDPWPPMSFIQTSFQEGRGTQRLEAAWTGAGLARRADHLESPR